MREIKIIFNEPLHHVCLMYGLRQTYGRMPFMNRKVIEAGGKKILMDNVTSLPPMMKHPDRASRGRKMRNIVEVSYFKENLTVTYQDELCSEQEAMAFAEALIQDYLHFRHPFLKTKTENGKVLEVLSGHEVAEYM